MPSRRNLKCRSVFVVLTTAALFAPTVGLAQERTLEGHWEGTIAVPGSPLEVNLDFILGEDGLWSGDISIPAQNAKDVPLQRIEVDGARVSFAIAGIPGEPTFSGTLSGDSTISGDFTQAGQTFPFQLVAADDRADRGHSGLTCSSASSDLRSSDAPAADADTCSRS